MLMVLTRVFALLLLAAAGAGGYRMYASMDKANNYNQVAAKVERIEDTCRPFAAPVQFAMPCQDPPGRGSNPGLIRETTVFVRYKSPADGKEHSGLLIPSGGRNVVDGLKLRAGSTWTILAHASEAGKIKMD